ncbi:hypothetical protein Bca101_083741 [Brassica carinata]
MSLACLFLRFDVREVFVRHGGYESEFLGGQESSHGMNLGSCGEEFCTLTERAIEEPNLRRTAEMKNMLYDPLCFIQSTFGSPRGGLLVQSLSEILDCLRDYEHSARGCRIGKNKIPSSHYGHITIFEAYQQHANSMTSVMKKQGDQQVLGGARNRWLG